MFDKLRQLEERYAELHRRLSEPQVIGQASEYARTAKAAAELSEVVEKFGDYKGVLQRLSEARHILAEDADREMRELAQAEVDELAAQQRRLEDELRALLLPRDPNDDRNVFVEIRAGAGGDEAALFAADLARMYTKYAERQKWKVEVMDSHPTGVGGFKEIILFIQGKGAWSRLKFERGVHRVQRVPATESSGRIHTSTVTVAVLPEAEDVDIKVEEKDIRVDVYRSSGPGRPGRQHHRLRGAPHPYAHRARGDVPGRALADQEPGEGPARAQGAPARAGAGGAGGRHRRRPPQPGGHRRAQRAHPHLQLSAGAGVRPPDRAHPAQAARR